MAKSIAFGSATHVGMVRSENQDSFGMFPSDHLDLDSPKGQLFVIADGMGGHAGGRRASSLAVETIQEKYFSSSSSSVSETLSQAFDAANKTIFEFSLNNPEFYGMGTTCIALVMRKDSAWAAHIGDSRLYKISRDGVALLTKDHSKVAELVRRGVLTEEEARTHPERSMLYRAMGVQSDIDFDQINNIRLVSDEAFLLCTDGLSNSVSDGEMKDIVLSHSPQDACDALVELANSRGGYDNITVQVIQVKAGDSFLKKILR